MVSLFFEFFDYSKWEDDEMAFDMVFETAVENDQAIVFDKFLERGFDLEDLVGYYCSYWHLSGLNMLRWYLYHNGNPNRLNPSSQFMWEGMTLLQYFTLESSRYREQTYIELLLKYGADVNFPRTPPISERMQPSRSKGTNVFLWA